MKKTYMIFLLIMSTLFFSCISYTYDKGALMLLGNDLIGTNGSFIYGAFGVPHQNGVAFLTYVNTDTKELYTINFVNGMSPRLFYIPSGHYEFFNFSININGGDFVVGMDITGNYSEKYVEIFDAYPATFSVKKGEVLYFGNCNVFFNNEGGFDSVIEEGDVDIITANMLSMYPELKSYLFTPMILKESSNV